MSQVWEPCLETNQPMSILRISLICARKIGIFDIKKMKGVRCWAKTTIDMKDRFSRYFVTYRIGELKRKQV